MAAPLISSRDENLWRYVNHQRPLISESDVVAFLNLEGDDAKRPDVEYYFSSAANVGTNLTDVDPLSDVVPRTCFLHPKFRGKITLKSKNPIDFPVIVCQLLSETEDVEMLYRLQQSIMTLNNTQALKKNRWLDSSSGILRVSQGKLFQSGATACSTRLGMHPGGANSMRNNKTTYMSVVNSRGRVHGFMGLIAADESVIPEAISGHNTAPTIMIAERVADFIKDHYKLL